MAKGYLAKRADPSDGRAKLVVWAERGDEAAAATVDVFARIERELADEVGGDRIAEVRETTAALLGLAGGDGR